MSILSVKRRPFQDGWTAEFDQQGQRWTEVYVVISNSLADWPMGIRNAVDPTTSLAIPQVGASHAGSPYVRARRVVPKFKAHGPDGKVVCDVEVYFDTKTDFAGVSNFSGGAIDESQLTWIQNPLLRPSEVSWGFEKIQIPKVKATLVSGNDGSSWTAVTAITNSAGQTFDPPLLDEKTVLVGTLSRNVATFSVAQAAAYINAVNSDVWLGLPPRTVKLADWQASRSFESNVWFWRETITIAIDLDTWDDVVLDQGLGYIGEDDALYVPRDPDDFAHGQPVRLDGSGAIITNPATASHYRRFRNEAREKPFDVLDIA